MSLADAAESLDDLASGRQPSQQCVLLGLASLDAVLSRGGCEHALKDAAATLELFVATGGVVSNFADARARYGLMAAAVRRVMTHD